MTRLGFQFHARSVSSSTGDEKNGMAGSDAVSKFLLGMLDSTILFTNVQHFWLEVKITLTGRNQEQLEFSHIRQGVGESVFFLRFCLKRGREI